MSLRKDFGSGIDAQVDAKHTIEESFVLRDFTVEFKANGITVTGTNPKIVIQTAEGFAPADGDYTDLGAGSGILDEIEIDPGSDTFKIYVIGLETRNFAVNYVSNDADGGDYSLKVTAGKRA